MNVSVFDLFKIGLGPSSSHTMGPMLAAGRFLDVLDSGGFGGHVARVSVALFGSLALTGRGHATDRAVLLGLSGVRPDGIDPDAAETRVADIHARKRLCLGGGTEIAFDPDTDLNWNMGTFLERHPNGLTFEAYNGTGARLCARTYFSIGGGFVVAEDEPLEAAVETAPAHPFATAADLLAQGEETGLSIWEIQRENERAGRADAEIDAGLDAVWGAMNACIDRGLRGTGELPGGLKVRRRASALLKKLDSGVGHNSDPPHRAMSWLSLYAIAVNEENAAGGRVVTAPTNGAAGVIPAVIRFYLEFYSGAEPSDVRRFLLAATAIGAVIKRNASLSGAEVGCQGEVGSACAMAAAGLATVLGGTNRQVENAAEIGLEHHLGMTCDPIGGLVQVPCIERNALGAVKAVNAATLALSGDGEHIVSLDAAVRTMLETGRDMAGKYKETAEGGLAVNAVEC